MKVEGRCLERIQLLHGKNTQQVFLRPKCCFSCFYLAKGIPTSRISSVGCFRWMSLAKRGHVVALPARNNCGHLFNSSVVLGPDRSASRA